MLSASKTVYGPGWTQINGQLLKNETARSTQRLPLYKLDANHQKRGVWRRVPSRTSFFRMFPMLPITPLSPEYVDAYRQFFTVLEGESRAQARLGRIQAAIARSERAWDDTLLVLDDNDQISMLMTIAPIGHGEFQWTRPVWVTPPAEDRFPDLFRAALDRVRTLNGRMISFRPLIHQMTPGMRSALEKLGFICLGERVEFKAPLKELPPEPPGTLAWKTMAETGITLAAEILERANRGAPHGMTSDENPKTVLEGYLSELGLTNNPSCVQIGLLDGRPAAFVCAQVEASTGWSRIAYMGLVPEARGKGLGREVHLHGIQMLREQGGTLYHGGTARENTAMIHLFQTHGCIESAAMMEWEWHDVSETRGVG